MKGRITSHELSYVTLFLSMLLYYKKDSIPMWLGLAGTILCILLIVLRHRLKIKEQPTLKTSTTN